MDAKGAHRTQFRLCLQPTRAGAAIFQILFLNILTTRFTNDEVEKLEKRCK